MHTGPAGQAHHDYADNDHVKFLISFMDPGQPYSCIEWGDAPDGGSPQIVHDTGYDIYYLFESNFGNPSTVWIDHNMKVHYKANTAGSWVIRTKIDEMLDACGDLCVEDDCPTSGTGDINVDGLINVIDIVEIVDAILNNGFTDECMQSSADYNADGTVNVIDIVEIVELILNP